QDPEERRVVLEEVAVRDAPLGDPARRAEELDLIPSERRLDEPEEVKRRGNRESQTGKEPRQTRRGLQATRARGCVRGAQEGSLTRTRARFLFPVGEARLEVVAVEARDELEPDLLRT